MMMAYANPIRTILIVDDDPFDSLLIERNLRSVLDGAEIKVVNDSREAMDAYSQARPDLVLLDISMPHVDGFQVLQAITEAKDAEAKSNGLAEDTASSVVMLSGSTSLEDKKRALKLGAIAYRVKPSTLAGYSDLAADLVSRNGPAQSDAALMRQAIVSAICGLAQRTTQAHLSPRSGSDRSKAFRAAPQ